MDMRRILAIMAAVAAMGGGFTACQSDDAVENDARDAGSEIEDEAGEVKDDAEQEIED